MVNKVRTSVARPGPSFLNFYVVQSPRSRRLHTCRFTHLKVSRTHFYYNFNSEKSHIITVNDDMTFAICC